MGIFNRKEREEARKKTEQWNKEHNDYHNYESPIHNHDYNERVDANHIKCSCNKVVLG